MRRLTYLPAAVLLIGLGVGCGDDDDGTIVTPPPPGHEHAVASVVITPDEGNLTVGQTLELSYEVWCGGGELLVDFPVGWTIDDASLAAVDAAGMVLALAPGTAYVTATADGVSDTIAVTITAGAARLAGWIDIEPDGPFVTRPEGQVRLHAMPYDEAGVPQPTWEVTWSNSNDHAVAFQNGLVRGLSVGDVWVTASSHGASDRVMVKVRDPRPAVARVELEPAVLDLWVGQAAYIEAFAYDADGNRIFDWVDWTSADPAMVSVVANGEGVTEITALSAPGGDPVPVEITGVCGGVPGTLTVLVNRPFRIDGPPDG